MGDLTDAKDHHSASLVNRVVSSIRGLDCDDVMLLAGNHDWLLKGNEFFAFLNHLPGVRFVTTPTEDPTPAYGELSIFLPYSKTPAKDWEGIDFGHYDYAFMHQTVTNARASNGQLMPGEGVPEIGVRRRVYSGDIHVPQTIGNVTYIGSPYHVHFGDDFAPRVLILGRNGREQWLTFPSPRRVTLTVSDLAAINHAGLKPGDQVKLRAVLSDADRHGWSKFKREAVARLTDLGVIVHGVELKTAHDGKQIERIDARVVLSPADRILRFVEREELGGDAYDAAMDVLES